MPLNKKLSPYIFATIMAIAMGFFISLFLTAINTGFGDDFFFYRWMGSFAIGSLIGFPISIIIAHKIVVKLTEE